MDPVVCHGDACNPNFLLDEAGHCVGYVDLGRLGVGDRWADLAPALLSLGWDFGEGWEPAFLDAYGVERDAGKRGSHGSGTRSEFGIQVGTILTWSPSSDRRPLRQSAGCRTRCPRDR